VKRIAQRFRSDGALGREALTFREKRYRKARTNRLPFHPTRGGKGVGEKR